MFFFSPPFSFFFITPYPFFHFFDEKWLVVLIITEQIAGASFPNGGDRQSVFGARRWLRRMSGWERRGEDDLD